MPWSRWCHRETWTINGFRYIASGTFASSHCRTVFEASGAQTAGDNSKYPQPFLIAMSWAIFWLSQTLKFFESLFLMTSYFFLLSAYIPCPQKVTIFMVSFWSLINYWTIEKIKKRFSFHKYFFLKLVFFSQMPLIKLSMYWIMKSFSPRPKAFLKPSDLYLISY